MKPQHRNLVILFVTQITVMIGFGIIFPILPFYVESFGAGGSAMGLLISVFSLMQFLFAPIWGSLSERYGRKPMLVLGTLGNALSQLVFGLATSLWMLFAARALAGILSSATLPATMAFISDSTSEEERATAMGMLSAAMGLGMVAGPGIGGLLGTDSLSLPFFVAAGLSSLSLILVLALLPESLPEAKRTHNAGFQGPQLREMWQALLSPIGGLLAVAFLLSFGMTNFEAVLGLYALERYGYGSGEVGTILMFLGIVSSAVQATLIGPLTRRFGDVLVLRGGLLVGAIGFALLLLPKNLLGVLLTTSFLMTGIALLRPSSASLVSRRTTVSQGLAMGLYNSFNSLGRIVGPLWAGFVFDINLRLPFLSGAVITFVSFIASLFWIQPSPAQPSDAQERLKKGAAQ
jgi:DHA1 family multidrug resistance protein-like MFS transporter